MVDLTNYDIDIKKPITQEEYRERIEKGLIKSGDEVYVYYTPKHIVKTIYIKIPPPMPDSIKYYELTNWREAKELYLNHRYIWDKFKSKGQIPDDVIKGVENV